MVRQRLMQLFGEAGQWASLVDASKLPTPSGSELHNSTRTEYKFMSQLKADMPLKDLAIWLGKYAGVTLTCTAKIEEYTVCALAKMAHSSASFKSFLLGSQDLKVNLCGLQQDIRSNGVK